MSKESKKGFGKFALGTAVGVGLGFLFAPKSGKETRKELNRVKRELGFESYKKTKFIYKYLSNYERLIIRVEKGKPRLKGYDFVEKYPKGTYILKMTGHITVVVDGVLYDLWDSRYRSVYTAWKIK